MTHVDMGTTHPITYKRMLALNTEAEKAVTEAGLDPLLAELVKIRVSQINGCAYCLRMHTRDALSKGETTDRLAMVSAWWECQYSTAQERAALALAEQARGTCIAARGTCIAARGNKVMAGEPVEPHDGWT